MHNSDNHSDPQSDLTDVFGPLIYSYTRSMALADGVLVDVTSTARDAGWRWPVAVTEQLWSVIQSIPQAHSYQSAEGRLWDVLCMATLAARSANGSTDQIDFTLILHRDGDPGFCSLRAHIGPGDEGEPVVTIGFPSDF